MRIKVGSVAHKELFCRQFIESHIDYDPSRLPWPDLTQAEQARLRSVPFWQEVYQTERRAGAIVAAFTPHVRDPLVREAVALQGAEELRHATLLSTMIARYGIDAVEQPIEPFPARLETAYIDVGFGDCLDAFLGFGAFKTARASKLLPEGMFEIFDVLMLEETRHIVFFINYMAWRQVQQGRGLVPIRTLTNAYFYARAARRLGGLIGRRKQHRNGVAVTQSSMFLDGFSFRDFVEDCYRENARRMEDFDPDLLQPRLLPSIADMAAVGLRIWDRRRPHVRKDTLAAH